MTDGYYECDRCGEFEKGPLHRKGKQASFSTDYSDKSVRKIKYGHRTGEENSGAVTRTADLCEQCRKALTEWFNDDGE